MKIKRLHEFNLTPSAAMLLQSELASRVNITDSGFEVGTIAGVDVSLGRQGGTGRAAVVVLAFPRMEIVETSVYEGRVEMPYIPGLLSFRELPLIIPALEQLKTYPDLFVVDGQGIAHPRKFGIAAHLGIIVDKPTIGCAKSKLCGEHQEVPKNKGSSVELTDKGRVIGRVVRTRENSKPVYISVGNNTDLETSVDWVLKLCGKYRLPEPIRRAHLAAAAKPGTG